MNRRVQSLGQNRRHHRSTRRRSISRKRTIKKQHDTRQHAPVAPTGAASCRSGGRDVGPRAAAEAGDEATGLGVLKGQAVDGPDYASAAPQRDRVVELPHTLRGIWSGAAKSS